MESAIKLLRVVGWLEGVSFLLLLGVAMPMKYAAGQEWAVQYVGWAHGLLFIALWLAAAWAWARGLPGRLALLAVVASVLPAGPFLIDGKLKRAAERPAPAPAA
ncbi:MAG: DUF3817 domain-containing protein [Planctomycetota bacterium]